MTLKCICSGSSGNCYTLTSNSGETLILDCGIPNNSKGSVRKQAGGYVWKFEKESEVV